MPRVPLKCSMVSPAILPGSPSPPSLPVLCSNAAPTPDISLFFSLALKTFETKNRLRINQIRKELQPSKSYLWSSLPIFETQLANYPFRCTCSLYICHASLEFFFVSKNRELCGHHKRMTSWIQRLHSSSSSVSMFPQLSVPCLVLAFS